MHDGCTGAGSDAAATLQKVRMMGFSSMPLPVAVDIPCTNCDHTFSMASFETACPECGMVYAVTPCSAGDPSKIKPAGVGV